MTSPTPADRASRWDAVERVSRVLSVAAIPVVLAVVGWLVQQQLQDQTVRRDYVQLAVAILQEPDTNKVSPAMRTWAIALLNRSAPVPLNESARAALQSGKSTLPSLDPTQVQLLGNLNAADRATRLNAYSSLTSGGITPVVLDSLLSQFEGAKLARLTSNGIVNGLSLLNTTAPTTWSAAQLARARSALARLDSLRAAGDPRVGPMIGGLQRTLRDRLAAARPSGP